MSWGMRFLLLGLLSFGAVFGEKPNVIVFLADDMGYADTGFTGSQDIKTPHLDEIARTGVVFERGYVNHAFCGPSRAALMSGRYQHRFGFETNPAYDPANTVCGIDEGEILFPARMQKVGYTTGCVGKWHLGAASNFQPLKRGFDYFYGFLGGGHDYFKIDLTAQVREGYLQGLQRNDKPAGFDGYLTTALSEDAAQFVKDNREKPFFLYVAYNAPHAPLQAPQEDIERYAHIEDKKRRVYAAMVDVMDRGIGEVMTALEETGQRENTLVFFFADNGGPQPREGQAGGWNGSSNAPFRGGKGDLYEGGVHVPFVASWPAKIPAGTRFPHPVMSLDVARTAVEVAGGDASEGPEMEGVDLIPFLTGEKEGAPHEAIFWRAGGNWAVVAGDATKLVRNRGSRDPQLFVLPEDVGEENDLASGEEERVAELRGLWEAWNEGNLPSRLMPYKTYHKERDRFFEQAVPKGSVEAGYEPKAISLFK